MDVHPPEHPIHTWRDFFVHIATIVVGLLIAIGLEQSVEWMHHRHLVHTAHTNLRAEAAANAMTLAHDEQLLRVVQASLLTDLQTLRRLKQGPSNAQAALITSWSWDSFPESAYNTARDTGAFALMPYEEVEDVDGVYAQQRYVNEAANAYILAVSRLRVPLQGGRTLQETSMEERNAMIANCSNALVSIDLLNDLLRSLGSDYRRSAAQ